MHVVCHELASGYYGINLNMGQHGLNIRQSFRTYNIHANYPFTLQYSQRQEIKIDLPAKQRAVAKLYSSLLSGLCTRCTLYSVHGIHCTRYTRYIHQ